MKRFSIILSISIALLSGTFLSDAAGENRNKHIGVFYPHDKIIQGIRFGNWGSRPYEYHWVSSIASFAGKKIIDLGVGLPSQYNWYDYVVRNLNPAFYAGIDFDGRIQSEVMTGSNFEIKHMNMASLEYEDSSFDIALCISTFEHIPYQLFMESIQEAHRVLKQDGLLILTLDEEWDKNEPATYSNGWNTLEQSLLESGEFKRTKRSFGLPEFLTLIQEYFVPVEKDAVIDQASGTIYSSKTKAVYYNRIDRDPAILNSGSGVNSCVSYAVLIKK